MFVLRPIGLTIEEVVRMEATYSYRLLVQKYDIPFIVCAIKCNVRNSIQKSGKDLPIIYWRGSFRTYSRHSTAWQCSGFGGTGDCFTYNPQYDSGSAGRGSTCHATNKTTYTISSALVSGGGWVATGRQSPATGRKSTVRCWWDGMGWSTHKVILVSIPRYLSE